MTKWILWQSWPASPSRWAAAKCPETIVLIIAQLIEQFALSGHSPCSEMEHSLKGFHRSRVPLECLNHLNCTCRDDATWSFFALCSISRLAGRIWEEAEEKNEMRKLSRLDDSVMPYRWCFVSFDSMSTAGKLDFPFLKNVFLNFCKTLPDDAVDEKMWKTDWTATMGWGKIFTLTALVMATFVYFLVILKAAVGLGLGRIARRGAGWSFCGSFGKWGTRDCSHLQWLLIEREIFKLKITESTFDPSQREFISDNCAFRHTNYKLQTEVR